MSHPEEPMPSPAQAMPIEAAATDGAPYRAPAPVPEAPEPVLLVEPAPRKPRTILGPALSVFAVLLWAFVVFGQLTTSWLFGAPLGQGYAVTFVFLTTFVAWMANIRRSREVLPPRSTAHLVARSIGIAVLAGLSFFVCVVAATAIGAVSSRNHDFLIAFGLVLVSVLAAIGGPRLMSPAPLVRTHRQRSALVMLWLAGVLVTLVAAADLAAHG